MLYLFLPLNVTCLHLSVLSLVKKMCSLKWWLLKKQFWSQRKLPNSCLFEQKVAARIDPDTF